MNEKQYWQMLKDRLKNATEIKYDGEPFLVDDKVYDDMNEFIDEFETDEEAPEFIFASIKNPIFDAYKIIDEIEKDFYDKTPELHLSDAKGFDDLCNAIKKFSDLNKHWIAYEQDTNNKFRVKRG